MAKTKKPTKVEIEDLKSQFKDLLTEKVKSSTKSINDQILEYQKELEAQGKTSLTPEQRQERVMAYHLFEDICTDYRHAIVHILAFIQGKTNSETNEEYYEYFRELAKEEEKSRYNNPDKTEIELDDYRFGLVIPIENSNSHSYTLDEIVMLTESDRQGISLQNEKVDSGNHLPEYARCYRIVTDKELTEFLESEFFDECVDYLIKFDDENAINLIRQILTVSA